MPDKKSTTPNRPGIWYKFNVHYASASDCLAYSLLLAVRLRPLCEGIYFARYSNGLASYAGYHLKFHRTPNPAKMRQRLTATVSKLHRTLQARQLTVALPTVGPLTPTPGSDAHAAAFEFITRLIAATENMEPLPFRELYADTLHWMHNMNGYDYVDEARLQMYGVNRILDIFAACINASEQKSLAKN